MIASHRFGVFAITFAVAYAIIYVIATEVNLALFTYHSALGEFGFGPNKPRNGPAMYWFGWIATSTICALVVGAIVAYLPDSVTRRLSPTLAWVAPLGAIVVTAGLMIKMYFFR
ncbi:MAG: hypothetical protein J0H89_08980 [Rhizobiales bacterium]|nr:hypothetical protein [Hyphomicrobiales bacterium]